MLAVGFCGEMKLLSAITVATVKATVVKKPKTFCSRTRAECMLYVYASARLQGYACERRVRVWGERQAGCRRICGHVTLGG